MTKNKTFLPDLSDAKVTVGTATTYSFRFKHGWAIFSVNDATGEFHVQSDWGNYQYRWHTGHLGEPTLTIFLAGMKDAYYVADKLHYGRPQDREEFDEDETKRDLRRRVGERYAAGGMSVEEARELLSMVDDLDWSSGDAFVQSFYDGPEELRKLTDEPYEWARHRLTASYTILTEALLPFFFDYLRREVLKVAA
jgi:hypothetical protein